MGKSHFLLNVETSKTNGDKHRRHIYATKKWGNINAWRLKLPWFQVVITALLFQNVPISGPRVASLHWSKKTSLDPIFIPQRKPIFSTEKTSTKRSSKLGWNQFWGLKIVQLHSWKWFGQTRWISAQKLLEILKITKATAWHEESLPNVCLAQGIQKYLLGCPIKLGLY